VPPKELSVYDDKHPQPKDAVDPERLKQLLTEAQEKQLQALLPKDKASLAKFQKIEHAALRAMMTDQLPRVAMSRSCRRATRPRRTAWSPSRWS